MVHNTRTENSKECNRCHEIKPLNLKHFHRDKSKRDGYHTLCKECRKRFEKSKERQEYLKNWRNSEQYKISKKKYNQSEKGRIKTREWSKHINQKTKKESISGYTYTSIHRYLKKIKKKEAICFICNEKKRTFLASIDHKYTKDPYDWLWLCRSCHTIFDKCRGEINVSS